MTGKQIKQYAEKRGWRSVDLAAALKVSIRTADRILKNGYEPSLIVKVLADKLLLDADAGENRGSVSGRARRVRP